MIATQHLLVRLVAHQLSVEANVFARCVTRKQLANTLAPTESPSIKRARRISAATL